MNSIMVIKCEFYSTFKLFPKSQVLYARSSIFLPTLFIYLFFVVVCLDDLTSIAAARLHRNKKNFWMMKNVGAQDDEI